MKFILGVSLFVIGLTVFDKNTAAHGFRHLHAGFNDGAPVLDSSTRSNHEQVQIQHYDFQFNVDVEKKLFTAAVEFDFVKLDPKATNIILDAKGLKILSVEQLDTSGSTRALNFTDARKIHSGAKDPDFLGEGLVISSSSKTGRIRIRYTVQPQASAFQWASGSMTQSGRPIFYTQNEPSHGRSWLPIQDTPAVRVTYSAKVKTSADFLALMSCQNNPQTKSPTGEYRFDMRVPVPGYLIALVVGELKFKPLSQRSGLYAEPSVIEQGASDFDVTEDYLAAGEKLFGPYQWGRYDMVLVPSFAYGGMENPFLTYLNTSVVTGDKSLTWVIAHEIAHSWTGNTVTNQTWEDFWLNEGWTTYAERRLVEEVLGKEYAETTSEQKKRALIRTIDKLLTTEFPEDAALKINLAGRDPDEAISSIPYDRGYFFLRTLEDKVGRAAFEQFTRSYISYFYYKTINTKQFIEFLHQSFPNTFSEDLLNQWIFRPGTPDQWPETHSANMATVDLLLEQFKKLESLERKNSSKYFADHAQELASLNHMAKIALVQQLPADLDFEGVQKLESIFGIEIEKNNQFLSEWYTKVVRWNYEPGFDGVKEYIARVARHSWLKPIYVAIAESKNELLQKNMYEHYQRILPTYGPITQGAVLKAFGPVVTKFAK